MHTNLSSKQWLIIHAEVPIEFLGNKHRKYTRELDSGTEQIQKKKEETHKGIPTPKHGIPFSRQHSRHPLNKQADNNFKQYSNTVVKWLTESTP